MQGKTLYQAIKFKGQQLQCTKAYNQFVYTEGKIYEVFDNPSGGLYILDDNNHPQNGSGSLFIEIPNKGVSSEKPENLWDFITKELKDNGCDVERHKIKSFIFGYIHKGEVISLAKELKLNLAQLSIIVQSFNLFTTGV